MTGAFTTAVGVARFAYSSIVDDKTLDRNASPQRPMRAEAVTKKPFPRDQADCETDLTARRSPEPMRRKISMSSPRVFSMAAVCHQRPAGGVQALTAWSSSGSLQFNTTSAKAT